MFDIQTYVDLATGMLPSRESSNPVLAMEVSEESCRESSVNQGDMVILEQNGKFEDGDLVGIRDGNGNQTSLRYFYRVSDRIYLQSTDSKVCSVLSNPAFHAQIIGKVIMIVHQVTPVAA